MSVPASTPETVTIRVVVQRSLDGTVTSSHTVESQREREILESWPSHGQDQLVFGLLAEAVRREAFTNILLQSSGDPSFLQKGVGDGVLHDQAIQKISQATLMSLTAAIKRLIHPAITHVIKSIQNS